MVYEIDPLHDPRWPRLLARHRLAGIFHSPEWLETVRRTYGYPAVAVTTSPNGQELDNALVFGRIQSWLTGKRLVSMPFSDHCAPLVDSSDELDCLLSALRRECDAGGRKYLEVRPPGDQPRLVGFSESSKFHLHRMDLKPNVDELYGRLHASCVRRKILRALRADLIYVEGRSEELLQPFYQLALLTRRRQKLPPQPIEWFRNLIGCLGDRLKIRLLFYSGRAVAGILTLRYREKMTFKYGFSDQRFHRLGSMQLLLWKAILDAKTEGLVEFDLGRSDWTDEGLTRFKDRWGALRSVMTYLRYPGAIANGKLVGLGMRISRHVFALAPDRFLATAGNVLYRHMAWHRAFGHVFVERSRVQKVTRRTFRQIFTNPVRQGEAPYLAYCDKRRYGRTAMSLLWAGLPAMLTCYRAICRPKYTIGTYNAAAHDGRSHYDGLIGESMKQLVEDIAKALVDIPDEV